MPKDPSRKSLQTIAERRREAIAQLCARGVMSVRKITASLAQMGIVNPHNGKPYSKTRIDADCQILKARWRESAGALIGEHRARQLAELAEMKSVAWGLLQRREVEIGKDAQGVPVLGPKATTVRMAQQSLSEALALESKILGTPAPTQITGPNGGPIQIAPAYDLTRLTTEEVLALRDLLARAQPPAALPGPV